MNEDDKKGMRCVRRKKQRKRRIRRRILRTVFLLSIITFLYIWVLVNKTKENKRIDTFLSAEVIDGESDAEIFLQTGEKEYEEDTLPLEIGRPVSRSDEEVLERLKELGQSSKRIQCIYENYKKYPVEMLTALANNPEMVDFVIGYLETETYEADLTEQEKKSAYPLFLQWDKRWGYHEYGNSNIGLSGCGPTSLSMVLYYLTRDEKYTPDYVADYSMRNGYYVDGSGTSWELMLDYPKKCGLSVYQPALMENKLISLLDRGQVIICAMSRGDFTSAGHFIVIYGYDETGFLVNDPNCVYRSQRTWTYDELQWQIKSIWAYEKNSDGINSVFERSEETIYFIEKTD